MKELLLLAYEGLTVLLPCALAYLLLRRCGRKMDGRRTALLALLACYVAGVFLVTGAGTVYELSRAAAYAMPVVRVNLIPFAQSIDVVGYALNVVMLVPFGLLAPLVWPQLGRLGRIILAGFSFSLLIELSQLVNCRSSDVDDLIMNTLGAVVGFALYRLLFGRARARQTPPTGRWWEPAVYLGAMFLGWFLLCNGLGAAALLYR